MAADSGGSIKPVAVIILGADMLVTASPATPIQLWHACLASGYDLAVPATWGDELIAAECLRALGSHPETVTVMCSCPMVARAVGDGEADLSAHLVSLVAPPVATARYLRRVYGERRVHITFAGACPAAGDSAIDAWVTPAELLERFVSTGVELARQPQLFESVLPPDRRRHLSQPGGVPTPDRAAALARPRQLIEVDDADVMTSVRRHLMGGVRALVDIAPRLGCACSGVVEHQPAAQARRGVERLEPPRSMRPVMPDPGGLGLLRRVPPRSNPRDRRREEVSGDEQRPAVGAAPASESHRIERPVAATRPATRSPLSWNLRERALPQPPTTGRTPGTSSHRNTAAGTWSTLGAPPTAGAGAVNPSTSTTGSAEAVSLDPATVAAARAVEARAKEPLVDGHDRVPPPRDHAVDQPTAVEDPTSGGRSTPPGGYWFVPTPTPEQPDVDVTRVAADGDAIEPPSAVPTEASGGGGGDGEVPRASPDGPASPPPDDKRDPKPPDRGWIAAMTIVLLLASALVARDMMHRRVAAPMIAAAAFTGRATADVVLVMGPGVGDRSDALIGSVFVAASDGIVEVSEPTIHAAR